MPQFSQFSDLKVHLNSVILHVLIFIAAAYLPPESLGKGSLIDQLLVPYMSEIGIFYFITKLCIFNFFY